MTELAIELGIKTSFTPPRILATRIATSETLGIIPLALDLAEQFGITALPQRTVTGIPHHNDVPVHLLTKLSTKPINRYRYIQQRQRTLYPVTPVHTNEEYKFFKHHMNNKLFKKNTSKKNPPHEAWRDIDFLKLTIFWNSEVHKQDRTVTDSSKRIYYKIPFQLEKHCKKVLAYKSECATVLMGSNATALKTIQDLLLAESTTVTLGPLSLPELPCGPQDLSYNEKGE